VAARYAMANHELFMELMEAALEALGIPCGHSESLLGELEAGYSQIMLNCYPACPQPDLTLGLPPHSDYCLFTLLLQDQVQGLQILHHGHWLTVDAVPGSIVANVGDHLEVCIRILFLLLQSQKNSIRFCSKSNYFKIYQFMLIKNTIDINSTKTSVELDRFIMKYSQLLYFCSQIHTVGCFLTLTLNQWRPI
jgi:hypothetical protein